MRTVEWQTSYVPEYRATATLVVTAMLHSGWCTALEVRRAVATL